ncbi:concanavalin A-like lectin protein kinase family protein [Actinidia rufa]|uniref:Concanavalin A-like lectin protein kinase family protein n=1 Tax=Actinidia rufa TaxID=165716 RepID=A0A7J0DP97_9ERIC|nr:concanavalin A-like lectin protein kinase family protein [Actinidia rufa]
MARGKEGPEGGWAPSKGKHLAEQCKTEYANPVNYCLRILAEVAVIAADIPEMILSFELPLELVPLLRFTSSEAKMGRHKNSLMVTFTSSFFAKSRGQAVNPKSCSDGLTFFRAPFQGEIPANSVSVYLGLFSNNSVLNSTSNHIVVVEFDTFQNHWDPNTDDQVGINVNSIASMASVMWNSIIKNGTIANAWVSYNSSTKTLGIYPTYSNNPVFSGSFSISHVVDLREVLPEWASVGWCHEQGEFLVVYEFMPNGSPDSHLFGGKSKLTLAVRYKIALGLALALLYLHEECEQCVVHKRYEVKTQPYIEKVEPPFLTMEAGLQQLKKTQHHRLQNWQQQQMKTFIRRQGEIIKYSIEFGLGPRPNSVGLPLGLGFKLQLGWIPTLGLGLHKWDGLQHLGLDFKWTDFFLGDFGLAMLLNHELGTQTIVLAGTTGYLTPECVTTGKASKKSPIPIVSVLLPLNRLWKKAGRAEVGTKSSTTNRLGLGPLRSRANT